jgi:putative transposase
VTWSVNGPALMDQALRNWLEAISTTSAAIIVPGMPWRNGIPESLNGQFRDDFLQTELLTTAPQGPPLANHER